MIKGVKNFPRYKQMTPFTCGVCVTRAVLEFAGKPMGGREARQALGWSIARGVSTEDIARVLQQQGLRAKDVHADVPHILQHVRAHGPVVVGVDGDHVALIHGVTATGVLLSDPSIIRPSGELSLEEFYGRYDGLAVLVYL